MLGRLFINERLRRLDSKLVLLSDEQKKAIKHVHIAPQILPHDFTLGGRPFQDLRCILERHGIKPSHFVMFLWPPGSCPNQTWLYDLRSLFNCLVRCNTIEAVHMTESLESSIGIEDPETQNRRSCEHTLRNVHQSMVETLHDGFALQVCGLELPWKLDFENVDDWRGRTYFEVYVKEDNEQKRVVKVFVNILETFRGESRKPETGLRVLADDLS